MSRAIPIIQPIGPKQSKQINSKIKIIVAHPFIFYVSLGEYSIKSNDYAIGAGFEKFPRTLKQELMMVYYFSSTRTEFVPQKLPIKCR